MSTSPPASGTPMEIKANNDKNVVLEFQPKIYMLDNELAEQDSVNVRYSILSKTVVNKIENDDDSIYVYGVLPVDMIPAAYLPFRYDNPDINFNRLTYNDTLPDSYYKSVFKLSDLNTKDIGVVKNDLKKLFRNILSNRLNNPQSIYNSFNINMMIVIACLFWFVILIFLMKVLYYSHNTIYTYLIFVFIVVLLLFAVVWKMIYTLQ